jgi:hypothetical protein
MAYDLAQARQREAAINVKPASRRKCRNRAPEDNLELTVVRWTRRRRARAILMSIEVSQEIEARLTDKARRLEISVETLLARLVGGHARPTSTRPRRKMPAWNLGAGALHRRDIYDDAH